MSGRGSFESRREFDNTFPDYRDERFLGADGKVRL